MFGYRFPQLFSMGLLLILTTACGTTRKSLRSELEQNDREHSTSLVKRRTSTASEAGPTTRPTNAQAALGQKIHRRSEWGALPANPSKLNIVGGRWERITVHHSDEVGALIFDGTFKESARAVRSIQRQHLEGNRWGDIGYHYLIDARGRIFEGRPITWQGAHAGNNSKNRRNIGICLLGNFNKHTPTLQSERALRGLLGDLGRVHDIPRSKIFVHSEFTNTECPGRHLTDWVRAYRAAGSLAHGPR